MLPEWWGGLGYEMIPAGESHGSTGPLRIMERKAPKKMQSAWGLDVWVKRMLSGREMLSKEM